MTDGSGVAYVFYSQHLATCMSYKEMGKPWRRRDVQFARNFGVSL